MLGTLASCCCAIPAQSADLTLRQLNHRVFTTLDGAPSDIFTLAQSADGTLWIGGRGGLARFDGIRFVPFPGPSEEFLPSNDISTLIASPDGGLWIGYFLGGASFLKEGHVTSYGERDGLPAATVGQFAWDRDASLWATTRVGLAHFTHNRWQRVTDEQQLGAPYGVLVDGAGTLWVASAGGLFARVAGESRFRAIDPSVRFGTTGPVLAASPDGTIWAAPFDHGLMRINRTADPQPGGAVTISGIPRGPLLFDAEGNLWATDAEAEALLRAPIRDLTREGAPELVVNPEKLTHSDGLSPGKVSAILEDRERNVWVSTESGLERFSRSNVVGDVAPDCPAHVPFHEGWLAAGDDGALWMACDDAVTPRVDEIRGGVVVSSRASPHFDLVYRDPQGKIWFSGLGTLGHFENGRIVSTPFPAQLRDRPVQALLRDSSGAMWVSFSRRSLFRFFNGEWSEYGNLAGLPQGYPIVETQDGGVLWFGYTQNRIARLSGGRVQLFDATHGLAVGNVMAILAQDGEIWVGGELGFARFNGTRFVSVRSTSGKSFGGLSGIVRALNGDFWLNGSSGIVHIPRTEIERVVREPDHPVECETYDYLDGVPGTAVHVRPQPSAIQTTDGRIWFLRTTGVVSIDATHLARNTLPPSVTIWSLTSGPTRYPNSGVELRLPVHSTSLQIEYTASSLTIPERVRFRYRLEGLDRDWQDVGSRREAVYTNLGPGHYRFRATASNNDEVWNNTGASITFTIPPAFYQTSWFYALCALACVVALTALYRVRMRHVAAQVRGRLEARLAERERIARELHDTLLQGMQGLIWRFQAATDRIPRTEPARQLMEQSLDRADKLLEEGRDRVKDLRPAAVDTSDLPRALAAEGDQFAQLYPAAFRVSVQGARRDLHPIVREEGFLIAREALANAFRHAGATNIEAEVTYTDSALHVRIRDDGAGVSAQVLAAGRPGHFGLIGMRERAKKLGAQVEVWSKPGAGTEVDLRVPAAVAYLRSPETPTGVRSSLATWWSSTHER
jgi:signal transduction histidine kinase/ligand-binding sensor domain-containing protein